LIGSVGCIQTIGNTPACRRLLPHRRRSRRRRLRARLRSLSKLLKRRPVGLLVNVGAIPPRVA
jgi:hypothetical protein